MTAINVVRFKVKPGREDEFVAAHKNMKEAFPGMRRAWLVKTGDRAYCIVGWWKDMSDLASARPAMIANLDKFRDCLEDLGGGLGVTDPVSGESVVELGGDHAGKGGDKGARGTASGEGNRARRDEKRAKKKAERRGNRKGSKDKKKKP